MKRLSQNINHKLLKLLYGALVPCLLLLLSIPLQAQVQLNDSAKVSVLTASPWYDAVYAYFGHTAIWVQDDSTNTDMVFNYGYFDSSQSMFMYNFVRGRTDYVLGVTTFEQFIREYGFRGQQVLEQELNLSSIEKQQLFNALYMNALPENSGYRYNYFYDNCATRPRDMVEKYTNGTVVYSATAQEQSFRDLVHECVGVSPWTQFGIDLLIGSDADKTIDVREKMFIPDYLRHSFSDAVIQKGDSIQVPLVKSTTVVLPIDKEINTIGEVGIFGPKLTSFALFLLTFIISLFQIVKMYQSRLTLLYDILLFSVAGLAGIVLFILIFFSEHPATSPNWNFVWLNPFSLIAAAFLGMNSAKKAVYFYHFINFALLTIFLLLWWLIPQQFSLATIAFLMCLWLRSGTHIYMQREKRIKKKKFTTSRHLKAGWGEYR